MRLRFVPILAAVPLFAQSGVVTSTISNQTVSGAMHMSPRPFAVTPVTGAPYSAQRVSEHVQIGADGTRFTTTNQQETIYRDSQGRTRTERRMMTGPNVSDGPTLVEISDPVANFGYTLDTQNKVAHRYAFQSPPARTMTAVSAAGSTSSNTVSGMISLAPAALPPPPPPPPAGMPVPAAIMTTPAMRTGSPNSLARPEVKQEDLGARMIEGVMAKGQRSTQTWPAGSQGNDRPFQTVSESWFSQDLRMPILQLSSDPRNGESTMKLINISLSEPPLTLFTPPSDFTVVDETGPFEIRWTAQRQ
jgi:hypothetical protein